MNEPSPHVISVRAIEDIIQIQKIMEYSPNLKTVQLEKNKSNERVFYSVLKHDIYSPEPANRLSNLLKECDVENSFKCNHKNCNRMDVSGWEGDGGLAKYVNPDVVFLENIGIIENTASDLDVKCWSSDSDVTVLRVKKEFRNELSNRVEWEEQRNLGDEVSVSSMNLDWESHSLINLAEVVRKEKDVQENLTPFTIWSKTNNRTNSSVVLMDTSTADPASELDTPEVRVALENGVLMTRSDDKEEYLRKKKRMRNFIRNFFSCFNKKKSF